METADGDNFEDGTTITEIMTDEMIVEIVMTTGATEIEAGTITTRETEMIIMIIGQMIQPLGAAVSEDVEVHEVAEDEVTTSNRELQMIDKLEMTRYRMRNPLSK